MKKALLLSLILGIGLCSYSQKDLNAFAKASPATLISIADPNPTPVFSIKPVKSKPMIVANTKAVSWTKIGTSGNMITVQMQNINCLSSWPDLNIIAFTHRSGGSHGPSPVNQANHTRVSFSIDGGNTFRDTLLKNDTLFNNRYPTGVVVNPAGNSIPMNAVLGYGGPYHTNPNNTWTGHYLCSERFDGSIYHLNYHPWTVLTGVSTTYPYNVSILNEASCSDQRTHGLTVYYDETTAGHVIFKYAEVINGTMTAADTVHYTYSLIHPAFAHCPNDATGGNYLNAGQAWSEDGNTGYVYFFGVDSITHYNNSCEPIVYKSTDKGVTWTKQPVFDFSTIPVIADSIDALHTNSSLHVPGIWSADESGVVDYYGFLHILTLVTGEYTNELDSIGYYYKAEPQKLYDIYTTSTGWNAAYISRINSLDVLYTDAEALPSSTGSNAMGWDHRLQASRTKDGVKLFATWVDEADTTGYSKLVLPDLYSYGWDIFTNNHTLVKNFTYNTILQGNISWMHASDRVLVNGTDYIIPVTATMVGSYQEDTCQHYYLSGVSFNQSDFVILGVNEAKGNTSIEIQNYPNPFNATTNISVNLNKTCDLTITVSDMLGQKVYESYKGAVSAGTHNYTFDGSKLQSGIYFYTIRAGHDIVTHKMIIE